MRMTVETTPFETARNILNRALRALRRGDSFRARVIAVLYLTMAWGAPSFAQTAAPGIR